MQRRLKQNYSKYLGGEIEKTRMDQCLQSYLGILSHANQYELGTALKNAYWVRSDKKMPISINSSSLKSQWFPIFFKPNFGPSIRWAPKESNFQWPLPNSKSPSPNVLELPDSRHAEVVVEADPAGVDIEPPRREAPNGHRPLVICNCFLAACKSPRILSIKMFICFKVMH